MAPGTTALTRIETDPFDWWASTDGEILGCLAEHGAMAPAELGQRLRLSEGEAIALLVMLAREGKIRICEVALVDSKSRQARPGRAAA